MKASWANIGAASRWIQDYTGLGADVQIKVIVSALIVAVAWLIRAMIIHILWQHTEEVRVRYAWQKVTLYATTAAALLVIGLVWLPALGSLTTFLGLLSAGLAIALRDLVLNVAAWLYILARRPFSLGDRILIGEHAGDVVDIGIFQFTLMEIGNWVQADQSTGRVLNVPNSLVFTHPLANYHKGFQYIWNEVPVLVTFESNWRKAKEILQKIATTHSARHHEVAQERLKEASRRYMIFYQTLTPAVYTSVRESGVLLTIRYLTEPRLRRGTEQAIWEDILEEFEKCDDIALAYPTQRYYHVRTAGRQRPAGGPVTDARHET